jgi:hypothetical protein
MECIVEICYVSQSQVISLRVCSYILFLRRMVLCSLELSEYTRRSDALYMKLFFNAKHVLVMPLLKDSHQRITQSWRVAALSCPNTI